MACETFYLPTVIYQGIGCFEQLGKVAASHGRKALLACGRHALRRAGILPRALELLSAAGVGCALYDQVEGEPTLPMVSQGIALARDQGCDLAIGLGGGSAMDVAKAVAGLLPLAGSPAEYLAGRKVERPGLPFIAVPTTAGTGAEATKNAVLIDPQQGVKTSIRHDSWFARAALVDPALTLHAPRAVTAAAGGDALCQAIETYVSIGASPITDALCEDALRRIGRSLVRVCEDGSDLVARADMLYGSLMGGMALANARLGAVHGMAHPLGFRYNIPHGVICALLLPHVMAYNLPYATAKYARIAEILGVNTSGMAAEQAAEAAVQAVAEINRRIGIPATLRGFGVPREDWPAIIAESLPSGSLKANPRPMQAEDVQAVLEMAIG